MLRAKGARRGSLLRRGGTGFKSKMTAVGGGQGSAVQLQFRNILLIINMIAKISKI